MGSWLAAALLRLESLGPKAVLLLNHVFVILASLLLGNSSRWSSLLLGRVFMGLAAGVATCVVPM